MKRALAGLALLAAGCHLVAGTQDFTDAPPVGGGGGGGAAPASEVCSDGSDNDDDGLADCDDPSCKVAGFACADPAPSGWTGPVIVKDGADAACDGAFSEELFRGGAQPSFEPAVCSTCSCTTSSVSCGPASASVAITDAGACDLACTSTKSVPDGGCVTFGAADVGAACVGGVPMFASATALAGAWSGTCEPSAQTPSKPAASFSDSAVVCGPPGVGAGCDEGRGCVQTAEGQRCIAHDGDIACPAGFPQRTLRFATLDDTRDCTPCSCADGSCDGALEAHASADCSGAMSGDKPTGAASCDALGTGAALSLRYLPDASASACSAVPSTPTGDVVGASPFTVCCPEGA